MYNIINILVVDDKLEKFEKISQIISEITSDFEIIVNHAPSLDSYRRVINKNYDIIIFDLYLPLKTNEKAEPDLGLSAIDYIFENDFIIPFSVFLLTKIEKFNIKDYKIKAASKGLKLWQYEDEMDEWTNYLKGVVISICKYKNFQVKTKCDIVILTALEEEKNYFLEYSSFSWEDDSLKSGINYSYANINERKVFIFSIDEKGMHSTAAFASHIYHTLKPQFIFMVGYCGAVGDLKFGDVIIADMSWDYNSGKFSNEDFIEAPNQCKIDRLFKQKIRRSLNNYKDKRYDSLFEIDELSSIKIEYSIKYGPMACGSAVISSSEIKLNIKKFQHKDTLALDMESYGLLKVKEIIGDPNLQTLVVKSISDHADEEKSDKYRAYASYTYTTVLEKIISSLDDN